MFPIVDKIMRKAVGAALLLSSLCLALLALCCLYQVLSRFIINEPVDWSESLARMLMVWIVFLGMPAAFQQGAMMSMEFLAGMVGRNKPWLVIVVSGLTIVLLGLSAWYGWAILPRVQYQMIAAISGASMMWTYLAIPVGMTISIFVVIVESIRSIREFKFDKKLREA